MNTFFCMIKVHYFKNSKLNYKLREERNKTSKEKKSNSKNMNPICTTASKEFLEILYSSMLDFQKKKKNFSVSKEKREYEIFNFNLKQVENFFANIFEMEESSKCRGSVKSFLESHKEMWNQSVISISKKESRFKDEAKANLENVYPNEKIRDDEEFNKNNRSVLIEKEKNNSENEWTEEFNGLLSQIEKTKLINRKKNQFEIGRVEISRDQPVVFSKFFKVKEKSPKIQNEKENRSKDISGIERKKEESFQYTIFTSDSENEEERKVDLTIKTYSIPENSSQRPAEYLISDDEEISTPIDSFFTKNLPPKQIPKQSKFNIHFKPKNLSTKIFLNQNMINKKGLSLNTVRRNYNWKSESGGSTDKIGKEAFMNIELTNKGKREICFEKGGMTNSFVVGEGGTTFINEIQDISTVKRKLKFRNKFRA